MEKEIDKDEHMVYAEKDEENTKKEIIKEDNNKEGQKKLFNWKLILIGFFIIIFARTGGSMLFNLFNYFYTNNVDIGWSERETQAYMQSCKSAASIELYYISNYEIALYCSCTLREVMSLYPSAPPSIEEYGKPDTKRRIQRIQEYCLSLIL